MRSAPFVNFGRQQVATKTVNFQLTNMILLLFGSQLVQFKIGFGINSV